MGTSIDEPHRISGPYVTFDEHSEEIADEALILGRDREPPIPEARRDLVARCARLSDLDDTRPDLEDITKVDVCFDDPGDREVLSERTRRRQVKTAFASMHVVLKRVNQRRHVRTAVIFVDVFVPGESKLAQPE